MQDQIDLLLAQLGTGKWNLYHFIAIGYGVLMLVPHTLIAPFVVPRLTGDCLPPDDQLPVVIPHTNDTLDSCSYFIKSEDGGLERRICTEWDFDDSVFTNTVTSEFSLACERDYYRATFQSMYMIGILVGSPINGILADRCGRRKTFVWGTALYMIMANISCWLPNLSVLLLLRFMLGLMHPIVLKCGYILAMEVASPKDRTTVGILIFLPWALGSAAWGGLAYLIRTWRYLLMTVSLPGLLLLPVLRYMDESPRWLLVRGEQKRAVQVLKKAAIWNRTALPLEEEMVSLSIDKSYLPSKEQEKGKVEKNWKTAILGSLANLAILVRTPRVRRAFLVTVLNYFVLGLVYFGLSLSGGNFNFDAFSFMALMGIMELPAYTLLIPLISRFGRKRPVAYCYLLCGLVLLVLPFVPESHNWVTIVLVSVGKMGISISFQGNNFYAVELFPTEVRTRGVSFSYTLSRVGSALAPFINDYLGMQYPWVPSVLFGGASAVAGLATLTLWETLGRPLPDTIAQLESSDFSKSQESHK